MSFKLEVGEYKFTELTNGKRFWRLRVKSNVYLRDDKPEYIDNLQNQLKAYIYSEYGTINGKITVSADTEVVGKNIRRSNETSNLRQALQTCLSMISKKTKAGYSYSDSSNPDIKNIYPMALDLYSKQGNKLIYPLYIQPKLDGVRCLVKEDGIVSRRLHDIQGFETVVSQCKQIFDLSKEIIGMDINFLDGEFYVHGKPLQDISGIVRKQTDDDREKETLEYHVFDVCVKGDMKFGERFKNLEKLFSTASNISKLKLVNTHLVRNEIEGDLLFQNYVSRGYEGVVYKSNSAYEYSCEREKRSRLYLKRKKQMDEEFTIISYDEGKGKSKGTVIFTLVTKERNEFKCVITGDTAYRQMIYQQCVNDFSKFKDKLAKVKFDDYSKNMTPVRGVIVQLDRDIEFD